MSLNKLVRLLNGQNKIAVIVGTVTDDNRLLDVPKLTVAALRFTETARAKIVNAGGKCLTLDQLVMTAPTGKSLKECIALIGFVLLN
jgi:large subunit ribosomal protein L18e